MPTHFYLFHFNPYTNVDILFPLVLLFFLPNTTTHHIMPLSIHLTLSFLLLSLSAAF